MTNFINPIAERDEPDSGKLITPEDAYKIRHDHKFFCPDHDCQDKERILTAKKSINDNYFFSHRPRCEHDIKPETLLHKSAIKWFIDKDEYEIPSCRRTNGEFKKQTIKLDRTKTECEFRKLKRIIPDVKLMTTSDFQFAIEIIVMNDISNEKSKLIEEFKLPTIRVDLNQFYHANKKECQTDYAFIQTRLQTLMTDNNLKSWAIPPEFELIKDKFVLQTIESNDGCLTILTGLGIVLLIKRLTK